MSNPPENTLISPQEALHDAVAEGSLLRCQLLHEQGADLEWRDGLGRTALHIAAIFSKADIWDWLMAQGANIFCRDSSDNNLLHALARSNLLSWRVDCSPIEQLCERGVCINDFNDERQTPLMVAVAHGNVGMLDVILRAGALVNLADEVGQTALHKAMSLSSIVVADILIERGADLTAPDADGRSPIQLACASPALAEHTPELLLKWHRYLPPEVLNKADHNGRDCLCAAIETGSESLVATLIAMGASARKDLQAPCNKHPAPLKRRMKELIKCKPMEAAVYSGHRLAITALRDRRPEQCVSDLLQKRDQ